MKKPGKSKRPKQRKRAGGQLPTRARAVPGTVAVTGISRRQISSASRAAVMPAFGPWPWVSSRDDRIALALLLAPFLIIAISLAAERTARQIIARAPQFIAAAQPPALRPAIAPAPRVPETVALSPTIRPAPIVIEPPPSPPLALPSLAPLIDPPLPSLALLIEPPAPALPSLALLIEPPPLQLPELTTLVGPPLPSLALLIEPPAPPLPPLALIVEPPLQSLALLQRLPTPTAVCSPTPRATATPLQPPRDAASFGFALAAAARAQLAELVIYNPKYQRIAYPMGDVAPLFGVCTDVIVRAYRSLGIDLQALVQETGSGRGDRNIDHRRVEVIRGFLARHGQSLALSELAEDYQPGDIVTYYRPQNRASTSHIAIVTDQLAPSGRPMIVHNRGWGPEMEDALFVDKITGHYRFSGLARTAVTSEASPAAKRLARHAQQRPQATSAHR